MNKVMTGLMVAAVALPLGACVPDYGVGPAVGAPPVKQRASIPNSISTRDNDTIYVSTSDSPGSGVNLCMRNSATWDKGFTVYNKGRNKVDKGRTVCTRVVATSGVIVGLEKRKFPGDFRKVGTQTFDFTGWDGYQVTMDWQKES